MEPEQTALRDRLLPLRLKRRLRAIERNSHPAHLRRAINAVSERLALHAALHSLLEERKISREPDTIYLAHTPLGQPLLRWRGEAAVRAKERGIRARNLHISFTHDGDAHLTFAAHAHGLRGLGIDIVHLSRLQTDGKDAAYLRRFARHFMSEEEFLAFEIASRQDDHEMLTKRVAAHFSLMEAASKALGTGLKIGGGMGRPASLPKQSIGLSALAPAVEFTLASEAEARRRHLNATRLEGYWSADSEYLVSAALLWE
jgi:phosphopantetheinyl transferase (holo-ACP synthase)